MDHDTFVIILGGGRGTRLQPLTKLRAKPAVPIGGKYRLIDIPISNCINSGLYKVFVLTQYLSDSLIAHVGQAYRFGPFVEGSVEILAAQQTFKGQSWYQGTADAVRQNLHRFCGKGADNFLILSGDHLYRMDYRRLLDFHEEGDWDVTVAVTPVNRTRAGSFGVLKVDRSLRIRDFHEKPSTEEAFERMALTDEEMERAAITHPDHRYLGSMGIYVFKPEVMQALLEENDDADFGKHILPAATEHHRVGAFPFEGYWEDIGTIRSYYEASLRLTEPDPPFRFHVARAPVYTRARHLSPTVIHNSHIEHTLLSDGAHIDHAELDRCVVGLRTSIGAGARLSGCIIMGADFYEEEKKRDGMPPIGIGRNAVLKDVVVDKNASIGEGCRLTNEEGIKELEGEEYAIRDGIIVVAKNAVIPPGTVI